MPEQLTAWMHEWVFTDEALPSLVFSSDPPGMRLVAPLRCSIGLRADALGNYPTTANIYVVTPRYAPGAWRSWAGFQADYRLAKDGYSPLTGIGFRLHDGTNQYWWNGAAWVVDTSHWNTEADVAAHIASFAHPTLQVVVNLTTTDKRYTTILTGIRVAWLGKIDLIDDLIHRSLVPALRDGIQPLADFAFKVPFPGGTTLHLGAAFDGSRLQFTVAGVDSVFNHTIDLDHRTNLLGDYNPTTKDITLTTAIPVGNMALVKLIITPAVSVEPSVDFIQLDKSPAIVITDIELLESGQLPVGDSVANKAAGTALRLSPPYRFNIRFGMLAVAPGAVDLARLIDSAVGYLAEHQMLRSAALDQGFRLMARSLFAAAGFQQRSERHTARAVVEVLDVPKPTGQATVPIVEHVRLRGDMSVDI